MTLSHSHCQVFGGFDGTRKDRRAIYRDDEVLKRCIISILIFLVSITRDLRATPSTLFLYRKMWVRWGGRGKCRSDWPWLRGLCYMMTW